MIRSSAWRRRLDGLAVCGPLNVSPYQTFRADRSNRSRFIRLSIFQDGGRRGLSFGLFFTRAALAIHGY